MVIGNTDLASTTAVNGFMFGVYGICLSQPGLTVRDSNGELVPGLAESWETNDSKVWTFHLRKDAVWDDGVPVTAQDVKFSFESATKTKLQTSAITMVASVEAPDNYTVVFNMAQPRSDLPLQIASFVLAPMHVYKDVENPKTYDGPGSMIGYGPYRLDSFDVNAGIMTYKANDKYWGGKPAIDEIEFRIFKNVDSMMMALEKGEIDTVTSFYGGISYYYVPKLLKDEDIGFSIEPNYAVPMGLWFNENKTPFDNREFREAISYALNYDEMCNLFTGGYGSTPTAGFVPNCTPNYIETRKLTYDVNKSKQMLESIGFADRDGDGFRELPNGTRFQPSIILRNDRPNTVRMAELIKTYMNNVGINVRIDNVDYGIWWDMVSTYKDDMTISITTQAGMVNNGGYGSLYFDKRKQGYSCITDPKFVGMIDELIVTTDQERAKQLGRDIQNYYAEELPAIPLYWDSMIIPYNKEYTGWTIHPLWGVLSNETYYNLRVAR